MRLAILVSAVVSSLVSILATLATINLLAPAAVEAQGTRIRAEEIVVHDAQGMDRLLMWPGPGIGARYVVNGPDGAPRVSIGSGGPVARGATEPLSANVTVLHPGISPVVAATNMGTDPNGRPRLLLSDREGRNRVRIALDDDGNPSIELRDASDNVIWRAPSGM
jgi:hypothetical protein